uniref:Uncharacterized protein n=1 Tax=Sphaerodactylus townsendi TaxID=933632 RepID=A0ACB8ET20_9SAUR
MVPSETLQYVGIVQLLLHFSWKWVGLIAMDNQAGEYFLQTMEKMLSENGICLAFTERAPMKTQTDTMASTLHSFYSDSSVLLDTKAKLHPFLQRIAFNNSAGDEITLNARGELASGFDITNLVTFPNNSYVRIKIGKLDPHSPPGKELTIHEDTTEWHKSLTQVR